jgi:hypothetical protein
MSPFFDFKRLHTIQDSGRSAYNKLLRSAGNGVIEFVLVRVPLCCCLCIAVSSDQSHFHVCRLC